MRVMVLVKASKDSEAGIPPSTELITEMMKFNEQLVKAGILLSAEGIHPSSKGKRIQFSGTKRMVLDGPFTETKELVGGFWIWQVKSMDEAVEWAKRCPNPTGEEGVLEIRPLIEMEDCGPEVTPELRELEERMRSEVAARK